MTRVRVIGLPVDVLTWDDALSRISTWASRRESRYVCVCNAHSLVTARLDPAFRMVIAGADMITADGAPVAAVLKLCGHRESERINGPDLMWKHCVLASTAEQSIFLYGSSPDTLRRLEQRLTAHFPTLRIAGTHSPPFRTLTPAEDAAVVDLINSSGASIVWVSLGCPKQETWVAAHRGRIQAVMIGVGAAFDYHAGTLRRAPEWMRRCGLEWFFRLLAEPRRLWRRYLITNSQFIWYAMKQLIGRC